MKLRMTAGLTLVLLLSGCSATSTPGPQVTVTVTPKPATPTLAPGDAAPWDLHAVCAAEAAISTLEQWRRHQSAADRLTGSQAEAVDQTIAVQYLEMHEFSSVSAVQDDVDALAQASGTLDHPEIDLDAGAVRTARSALSATCSTSGLTLGIYAQGG